MKKHRATRRVEFHDTDSAGIMHFSAFFQFMEEAEHELLRSVGLSVFMPPGGDNTEDVPLSWPRVSANCDFRNALRFEDEVSIRWRWANPENWRASLTSSIRMNSVASSPSPRSHLLFSRSPIDRTTQSYSHP